MCLAEESLGGSQVGFQLSVYWRRRMGWSEGIDGLGSTTRAGRQSSRCRRLGAEFAGVEGAGRQTVVGKGKQRDPAMEGGRVLD